MRIIELFAGIGACSTALKRIGIDLEIVDAVEIDKYAIASFNAIHGTNFETQDITTWNKDLKDIDLITHGSPCQDFSVAGKQAGGDIGSGTRSSLMYETIRIVGQVRPKYVLWENVKNILSKKHRHNFDNYLEKMKELGYTNYYQVLNAKDYGIPQNRERVYTISIRKDVLVYDDYNSKIRKDQETIGTLTTNCGSSSKRNGWKIIEANENFKFPEKEELKLRLKDMLEDEVDEKYYLSERGIEYFKEQAKNREENLEQYNTKKMIKVAHGYNQGSVKDLDICPTLDINFSQFWRGVILEPKLLINNGTKKGYDEAIDGDAVNLSYPNSKTRRGRVGHQVSQTIQCNDSMGVVEKADRVYSGEGIIPTIHTCQGGNTEHKIIERTPLKFLNRNQKNIEGDYAFCVDSSNTGGIKEIENNNYRIRKLTPKECWRLMGFSDEDFEKAANIPTSNTQLYKQAGNSIVVNVLEKIFKNLFKED